MKLSNILQEQDLESFYRSFLLHFEDYVWRVSRNNVPQNNRRMDSFARIIEGGSTCTSVFYDGDRLYISSNDIYANKGKIHLLHIQAVIEYFCAISNGELNNDLTLRITIIKKTALGSIKKLLRYINNYDSITLEKKVEDFIKKFFATNLSPKKWLDSEIKLLDSSKKFEQGLIKQVFMSIKDLLKLETHIKRGFLRDIFENINNTIEIIVDDTEEHIHAEIRILKKILIKIKSTFSQQEEDMEDFSITFARLFNNKEYYFGVSMLCCAHCSALIKAFSKRYDKIITRGQHGQVYQDYPLPENLIDDSDIFRDFIGNEAYDIFQRLKHDKKKVALKLISFVDRIPNESALKLISPEKKIKSLAGKKGKQVYADLSDSDADYSGYDNKKQYDTELEKQYDTELEKFESKKHKKEILKYLKKVLPELSSDLDILDEDKLRLLANDNILDLVLEDILSLGDIKELSVRKLKFIAKHDWLHEIIQDCITFRENFIELSEDDLKYTHIFKNETFILIAENEGIEEAIEAYKNLRQVLSKEDIFNRIDEIYEEFERLVDDAFDDYKFAYILANRTFSQFVNSYQDESDYEDEFQYLGEHEEEYNIQEFDESVERLTKATSSFGDNEDLYAEDDMSILLNHYLPNQQLYYVAPQTQFENAALLSEHLQIAIERARNGSIAVIPVHLHYNHWVGVIIRLQADDRIEVIYVDPMGNSFADEPNALLFIGAITILEHNAHIVDLDFMQQHNGHDCGPFTVDNLRRLAEAGDQLDNLNAEQIIALGILSQPENGSANHLRNLYELILNPQLNSSTATNAEVESNNVLTYEEYSSLVTEDSLSADGLAGISALLLLLGLEMYGSH